MPWDRLAEPARLARAHPDGVVDLSVGTPVDPVPAVVRAALAEAGEAHGYPPVDGGPRLRTAAADWFARRLGVRGLEPDAVLATIGSKELIALLPFLVGARANARVGHPVLAYPTYAIGARLANAEPVPVERPPADSAGLALVWLNSPSNPTGRVLDPADLRAWVTWGRTHGVPIVNDECYIELGWDTDPRSILHPDVCGTDHAGVLAVHSLSKRSNLAGYRAGLVAGDPALVSGLRAARRHAGLLVPAPVAAAMVAALGDDEHVATQRARYFGRREALGTAFRAAGFTVEASEAGLYLWVTRGEDCWASVRWLAERGILTGPGEFYGPSGQAHVRVALTATDERVDAAVKRLTG